MTDGSTFVIWVQPEDGSPRQAEQYGLSRDLAEEFAARWRLEYPDRKYAVAAAGVTPAEGDYS